MLRNQTINVIQMTLFGFPMQCQKMGSKIPNTICWVKWEVSSLINNPQVYHILSNPNYKENIFINLFFI